MSKYNVTMSQEKGTEVEPQCAVISGAVRRSDYPAYVGLDVHKETIAVSVARAGREAPIHWGEIANELAAVSGLVSRLSELFGGERLLFCYEAGPCGYVLYRQLVSLGQSCEVVAPSLMLRAPGERIKTDRRDSAKLSVQSRSGVLTGVWVPDTEQGEVRDAYVEAIRAASERVARCNARLNEALPTWSLAPLVPALSALRGIDRLAAISLLAELGDISRFASPKQLMAYLGLVPQVHSSGLRCRRGAITRTGNTHARRLLVECAWSYRFPARRTAHMRRKVAQAPQSVQAVAWKAQNRLCGRYRHLQQAGFLTR